MRFVLIGLILVVAVGAVFFVLQTAQPQQRIDTVVEEQPEVRAVKILVARQPISAGTVISEKMLDQQPWPEHLLLPTFIVTDGPDSNIVDMVARADFQPQEPISRNKLANRSDPNFIAAAIGENMRAITMEIDTVTGIAGYIFPGDRVDIIMTHKIPADVAPAGAGAAGGRSNTVQFAETVLSNIKIMAVGIRGLAAYNNNVEKQQRRQPQAPTNVTLEVTPEQAQAIRLAEKAGGVSLALRALDEQGGKRFEATTLVDLTAVEMRGGPSGTVNIVRGVSSEIPGGAALATGGGSF